ncbi:MAG: VWA domain-containing protein [Bacteroidota bacterium]
MRIRFSRWLADSSTDEVFLQSLISLFGHLLLQASGDVHEALEWLRQLDQEYHIFNKSMTLDEFIDQLKELGLIEEVNNIFNVTARGVQRIRQDALNEIFRTLTKSTLGTHETPYLGTGVDRLSETKKYHFGDQPMNIDVTSTITNALKRNGIEEFRLTEDDLEVYETEHTTSCATILMLDISHSMILYGEDRITPAKQVALALSELIHAKYPKDIIRLVTFGDYAEEVGIHKLPFLSVGPYHTNTKAGLQLARNLLRRCGNTNKQIFMITDGKPSAIFEESGKLYKNSFGLDPRIVNKTLDEAVACRREHITISTFMVARDPYLKNFVEELTKANRGRAYYSSVTNLGEFLFVDYIRNRRKRYTAGNL